MAEAGQTEQVESQPSGLRWWPDGAVAERPGRNFAIVDGFVHFAPKERCVRVEQAGVGGVAPSVICISQLL